MTRNQIVSAICSFVVIWVVLLAGWLLGHLPGIDPELCRYLSAMVHIEDLARGTLDPRPICLALTVTGFMLFTATRILESRHWR